MHISIKNYNFRRTSLSNPSCIRMFARFTQPCGNPNNVRHSSGLPQNQISRPLVGDRRLALSKVSNLVTMASPNHHPDASDLLLLQSADEPTKGDEKAQSVDEPIDTDDGAPEIPDGEDWQDNGLMLELAPFKLEK